jgi:hypothetical protein
MNTNRGTYVTMLGQKQEKTYSTTFVTQKSAKLDDKDDKYVVPCFNV